MDRSVSDESASQQANRPGHDRRRRPTRPIQITVNRSSGPIIRGQEPSESIGGDAASNPISKSRRRDRSFAGRRRLRRFPAGGDGPGFGWRFRRSIHRSQNFGPSQRHRCKWRSAGRPRPIAVFLRTVRPTTGLSAPPAFNTPTYGAAVYSPPRRTSAARRLSAAIAARSLRRRALHAPGSYAPGTYPQQTLRPMAGIPKRCRPRSQRFPCLELPRAAAQ